jgi:hypothetical protein
MYLMRGKIGGICAALVAFAAFAIVPAIAAASPVLTENGAAVAAGSKVTGTGQGTAEFDSGFIKVFCNDYWMTGSVHRNTGTVIEGTIESALFENKNPTTGGTEDCGSSLGATKVTIPGLTNEGGTQHWCVISSAATGNDKAQVVPHSCTGTGGAFTFVLTNTPNGTVCRYTRTAAINVTYATNVTPVTLTMEGEPEFTKEEPSGFLCSATGKIKSLSFTLETDGTSTGLSIS